MGWISGEQYQSASPDPLAQDSWSVIQHMNEDHSDALRKIAQHLTGATAHEGTIAIVELDSTGCTLLHRSHGTRTEIPCAFPSPVTSAEAARSMFISLLKSARTAAPKAPSDKGN